MDEIAAEKFDFLVQLMTLWSRQWEAHILAHGAALSEEEMQTARCVGIIAPEKVRILTVPNVPLPHYKLLHEEFVKSGLFGLDAHGLTLGYGVFLKFDCFPRDYWLAHELVHVAQMEQAGDLSEYVRRYFAECLNDGYAASELERAAHETALRCLAERGIEFNFEIELG